MERATDGLRGIARNTFVIGTWILVVAVLVQVLLAGMGVFSGDATYFIWHANYNSIVVFALPLALLAVGRYGGIPPRTLWLTAAIPGLVILQSILLIPYHMQADGLLRALAGLHVVNALFIFWVAMQLLERARELGRQRA